MTTETIQCIPHRRSASRSAVPRAPGCSGRPTVNGRHHRDRRSVVERLAEQETTRVPSLVPIRHERMAVSPFTFYRGAANVMAADLSGEPDTGLQVQLCGDAHLANFGGFATPERTLIFDINDFDETLPGPFEWDLKRLAASFEVAGRSNEFSDRQRRTALNAMTLSYVRAMHEFSLMSNLEIWYTRLTAEDLAKRWGTGKPEALLANFRRLVAKAETKDRLKAMNKLTTVEDGEVRFRSDPPLLEPVSEIFSADRAAAVARHGGPFHRHLPPFAPARSPCRARAVPVRRPGPEGGRCRQRRDAVLGRADDGAGRPGPALPPGQGGRALGDGAVPGRQPLPVPRPSRGRGSADDAVRQRHLPGMGPRRPGSTVATTTTTSVSSGTGRSRPRSTP